MEYHDADIFLENRGRLPVIDVRSPSEFLQGHIPGAFNIPLFNDEDRSQVGVAYHKQGRAEAVKLGLRLAGPRLESYVDKANQIANGSGKLIVYCWRGGMRSESMAWLFEKAGFYCQVINGGYRAYRRLNREKLGSQFDLIILGGYTGSAKTLILHEMEKMGAQVLDLEGLANHRGSAFGGLGMEPQPTTEHYENLIAEKWSAFDHSRPVWIEDESLSVGSINVPEVLYLRMKTSMLLVMQISEKIRINNLVNEYAGWGKEKLICGVKKIEKKLGMESARLAQEAIGKGNYGKAAGIILHYYDKAYQKSLNKRNSETMTLLKPDDFRISDIAGMLSKNESAILDHEIHLL